MTSEEIVVAVIDALEQAKLPYMVVGALSSNLYGIPRSTEDADFVVQFGATPVEEIVRRLGPPFRLEPQVSFETVTSTVRYIIETGERPFRVELFHLSDDPHDQERFARRQKANVLDRTAFAPTAEDVIITKLRWSHHGQRSRDTEDARNVMAVQADNLDWEYIHRWCDQHGTRELLSEIRRSIPKN